MSSNPPGDRAWRCETCRFWAHGSARGPGACRINPPVVLTHPDSYTGLVSRWPETHPHEWCGRWIES